MTKPEVCTTCCYIHWVSLSVLGEWCSMLRPREAMPVGVALMLQVCFCCRLPLWCSAVLRSYVCWRDVIMEQEGLNVSFKLPVCDQPEQEKTSGQRSVKLWARTSWFLLNSMSCREWFVCEFLNEKCEVDWQNFFFQSDHFHLVYNTAS